MTRKHFRFRIGLLDKWKERNGPMATYRQLAKSLHEAEVIGSVHALCMELGAPENAMIASTAPEWPAAHHTPPPATPPQPQPQGNVDLSAPAERFGGRWGSW